MTFAILRDEARKHIDKAIALPQPTGECQGMRHARSLLEQRP